ncbi:hypothetical protein [Nonomuraea zeae]|uniref:Uncharacterized protein n=1 Tax=Nonomuraea zeae TaxID=1642303 RepID=A0A5S4GYV4_9ACTN|nr:hypothetical protein [Nonomuraea zeae]TMR38153.1 hypothetical protein ETD85_05870 [Nonomuraea zeae]
MEWNNVESHNCGTVSPHGVASVYGVLSDGRLTYTSIDAATGERTAGAEVSEVSLGFKPKAMATLDFNTLLVTEDAPGGRLYRVDIVSVRDKVTFATPVFLGTGYTHDLLAYDGSSHLFGIADGSLHRYFDEDPQDGQGDDLTGQGAVDTGGWTQVLLSTSPDTVT